MTPHVDKANAYARDVVAKKIPACKWVRKACQRHLSDLKRAEGDWPFRFDAAKAERVCAFGEKLPHVKGKWARRDEKTGKAARITLEPWQCFVLSMIFGWVKKANGMRRFRRASIYIPRKNAKSTTACIIGWWMFAKDDEPGAEIYCGATSEKQAWEVFGPARRMAIDEPALPEGVGATINARSLVREKDNAKFEPIIGKPGDGASPHLAIVDEYHEHMDSTHYDTMKTGMGAREQPLLLVISTAGDNIAGPCFDDWTECEKLLDGIIEDDTHFAIIWTVDDPKKWTDEKALRMANPNWGVSVNPEIILPDQRAAVRDVAKQATFKTKHLNLWVAAANGWLNMEQWRRCHEATLKIEDFEDAECWVAIDAAAKIDMTSLVAVFPEDDGGFAVFARHYLPEDTISLPQNQHYRNWRAAGELVATPGARTDFAIVENDLRAWADRFNVKQLAYDPKELTDFINRVGVWASFARVEIRQSPKFLSEPMKELEAQVAAATLRHTGDSVLTWMASNVIKKEARGGGSVKYYYPTKARDQNKIDGIVALIMGIRQAKLGAGVERAYDRRGVRAL